jgi:hypothetical protein
MQLLVSVRSAEEVGPAFAGGADIVDAKEPARGSLGPVDLFVLREINAKVPPCIPLSVALGDFQDEAAAAPSRKSPSATLSGTPGGTLALISRRTDGSTGPREPRDGSLASMMSAPPARAGATSSADRTLTNSRIRAPL